MQFAIVIWNNIDSELCWKSVYQCDKKKRTKKRETLEKIRSEVVNNLSNPKAIPYIHTSISQSINQSNQSLTKRKKKPQKKETEKRKHRKCRLHLLLFRTTTTTSHHLRSSSVTSIVAIVTLYSRYTNIYEEFRVWSHLTPYYSSEH